MTDLYKILIAEDDVDIGFIYSLILKDSGFNVEVAKNAAETFDKLLTFQPDAMLLDIMMPGQDGLEVLHIIRTDPKYEQIQPKILITTNIAQEERATQARENGAQGYLVKANIDPHELSGILNDLLSPQESRTGTFEFFQDGQL